MELYEDTHLCLRCGKTIEGLDNYVSHRQHLCHKFQQPSISPFLSDSSGSLASTEPQVDELQSVFPHDVYKLSASDFFLSLNLQSNYKSTDSCTDLSCEIQKNQGSASEGFCSRLEIPTLDNDLVSAFSTDKQLCSDVIMEEQDCIDINNVVLSNEKWDSFKIQTHLCETSQLCSKDGSALNDTGSQNLMQVQAIRDLKAPPSDSCASKEIVSAISLGNEVKANSKKRKKKMLKQYSYSQLSILNVPRTSYRQKLNANDSLICCQGQQKFFTCFVCNLKFSFLPTFLDHLLVCTKKCCDIKKWEEEVLRNESLFIRSSHFRCLLCLFFCSDSFVFLEHLTDRCHRQNAASLKNPLICLPCQDECSASDEIKQHFSKNHLQYSKGDHPIIITEKKKNVHCCFCLSLIKSSSRLQYNESVNVLLKEDVDFIKSSLPKVSSCAFGVDKNMFNSYLSKASDLMTPKSSESCKNIASDSSGSTNSKCIDVMQLQEPQKDRVFKKSDKKRNKNITTKRNTQLGNEPSAESNGKRLIAKITSLNGKFVYKKLKIGHSKKIWVCDLCGVKHFSKLSLQRHTDVCDYENRKVSGTSLSKCKKNNHDNKCSTNRQYLCDKCGYVGKSFNQLTRHSRSHSGEKPFKCPHCNCKFALSSQLIRHKRLHTGIKPYKCPYCSYMCNTQENLRKHILQTKKHKGKMVYPCQHCNYESNEFSTYRDHLLKSHPERFPNGITSLNSSITGL